MAYSIIDLGIENNSSHDIILELAIEHKHGKQIYRKLSREENNIGDSKTRPSCSVPANAVFNACHARI